MKKLTPEEMEERAILTRARAEGTIVRQYFLNEVLPAIKNEIGRLRSTGQEIEIKLPPAEKFAKAYVQQLAADNNLALGDGS